MKKNNLIKEVMLDYKGIFKGRALEFKFKNKITKSKLYISKKTGTIFHSPSSNSSESLKLWDKKIYSNKINTSKIKYTANNPIMKSRHYYSALFINKFLKKKKIKFCDYGSGEGNFGIELKRINKNINFNFTEHSSKLFKKTKNKISKLSNEKFLSFNGSIEDSVKNKKFSNFDACSMLWTLCNCVKPLEVLSAIYQSLKVGGLLLVSESSRILVPPKKPIYNYFVSDYEAKNTHPWFFSFNSLSNLLEVSGFRIIESNRYFDENDIIVVAKKMNKKNFKPKILIDKFQHIKIFLKDWEKSSYFLKKFY